MTTTTLPTLLAVKTVHRAQSLLQLPQLTPEDKNALSPLTDAVLSFTTFYLRFAAPKCRPAQLSALGQLQSLVNQLEKKYGTETSSSPLDA